MENTTDLFKNSCISYWKSWFSIAMLVYLRVSSFSHPTGFQASQFCCIRSIQKVQQVPPTVHRPSPTNGCPSLQATFALPWAGIRHSEHPPHRKDRVHHGWSTSRKGDPIWKGNESSSSPNHFFKYVRLSRSFQGKLPSGKKCFLTFAVEKKFLGKEYPVSAIRHEI